MPPRSLFPHPYQSLDRFGQKAAVVVFPQPIEGTLPARNYAVSVSAFVLPMSSRCFCINNLLSLSHVAQRTYHATRRDGGHFLLLLQGRRHCPCKRFTNEIA